MRRRKLALIGMVTGAVAGCGLLLPEVPDIASINDSASGDGNDPTADGNGPGADGDIDGDGGDANAVMSGDGAVDAFVDPCPAAFEAGTQGSVAFGQMFIVGGFANGIASGTFDRNASLDVLSATLYCDGTLPQRVVGKLPGVRFGAAAAALNGYLVVLGGTDESGALSNVAYAAPIGPDGGLGAFAQTPSVDAGARYDLQFTTSGSALLVLGGRTGPALDTNTAFAVRVDPTGKITSAAMPALPSTLATGTATFDDGTVFVSDGAKFFQSTILSDGGFGPWSSFMGAARIVYGNAFVADHAAYVVGRGTAGNSTGDIGYQSSKGAAPVAYPFTDINLFFTFSGVAYVNHRVYVVGGRYDEIDGGLYGGESILLSELPTATQTGIDSGMPTGRFGHVLVPY